MFTFYMIVGLIVCMVLLTALGCWDDVDDERSREEACF